MLLKDKTIVLTGCYQGIGKATLEELASNGANVWAFTERVDADFEQFVEKLQAQYKVKIYILQVNLFEEHEIKVAFKQIIQSKTAIHGLVNIAGMTHNALLNMTTMQDMRRVFDLNFFAQMLMIQFSIKVMQKHKVSGSIINISSVSALDGNRGQVAYSSSKAALIGVTKTLADELGESGIRVNAVAPGIIDSSMTAALNQEDYAKLVNKTSMNRAGKTIEVAKVLVYLLSDNSSYVTGQVIRVDGGM